MIDQEHKDLRPHQIEEIYFDYDEPFKAENKTVDSWWYYGIGLFIVILILGFIIKIPREVSLSFELRGGEKEVVGQYSDQVYVQKKWAKMGEDVKRGMPLVSVTSEKIVNYLEKLRQIQFEIEQFAGNQQLLHKKELELLKAQAVNTAKSKLLLVKRRQDMTVRFKSELTILNSQLELTRKDFNRNKKLLDEGVISQKDFDLSTDLLKEREYALLLAKQQYQSDLILLEEQIINKENLQLELEGNFSIDSLEYIVKLKSLDEKSKEIVESLKLSFGDFEIELNELIINSPHDGEVTLLTNEEALVDAGEIIWKVSSEQVGHFITAETEIGQVGSLKVGQKVIVKYEDFPHYYYGTMIGEIAQLSSSPTVRGTYLLNVEIEDFGRLKEKIIKGMKGEATVVVEDLPVFYYLFRSFFEEVD